MKSLLKNINLSDKEKYINTIFSLTVLDKTSANNYRIVKCTCGYETRTDDLIKKCPECGTTRVKDLMSYTRDTTQYITSYDFTPEKASIKHRTISYYADSDNLQLDIETSDTEFVYEYVTNKKGTKKLAIKKIKDGEESRLLKADLYAYWYGCTDDKIKEAIKTINGIENSDYNMLAVALWGIQNKYKLCPDAIAKRVYEGYDYNLDSLRKWNDFIKTASSKKLEYIKKYISVSNYRNSNPYIYIITNYFDDKDEEKVFKTIDLLIELDRSKAIIDNRFPDRWRNLQELSSFMVTTGFTLEELLKFVELADRQAYDLRSNAYKIFRIYRELSAIKMPIDKKPRELAIYMSKMEKLLNLTDGCSPSPIKLDGHIFKHKKSHDIIKKVYDVAGYKGLDELLFNCLMGQNIKFGFLYIPYQEKIDKTIYNKVKYMTSLIFYKGAMKEKSTINCLITKDNQVLTDKEEIKEYISNEREELMSIKEEATC